MKKEYINPEMLIVKINAQQLLSGSALGKMDDAIITDEGDVLSRELEEDFEDGYDYALDEEDF